MQKDCVIWKGAKVSEFNYLLARGKRTRTPALCTANSFEDFSTVILSKCVEISINKNMTKAEKDAEKDKLYWYAAPVREKGARRLAKNIAPTPFGGLDIDAATPGAIPVLRGTLQQYSAFAYHTASHTAEAPRLRAVFEYARPVQATERKKTSEATETLLMQQAGFRFAGTDGDKATWRKGDDYVVFDRSVYGAQSFLYCPDSNAETFTFDGVPLNVDKLPTPAKSEKAKRKPATSTTSTDGLDETEISEYTFDDLRSALYHPPVLNLVTDYATRIRVGSALAWFKGSQWEDEALELWTEWYCENPEKDHEAARHKWDHDLTCERTGYAAIFALAQRHGWQNPGKWRLMAQNIAELPASKRAELLANFYGQICIKADNEQVHRYTGAIWEHLPDMELRRQMARMLGENGATFTPHAVGTAVESMKLIIPYMGEASRPLIGFANGVYDLEQKAFRPHSPDDWITCHNGVTFTDPQPGENLKDHAPAFYRWLFHCAGGKPEQMERTKAALFMVLANRYDWQLFIEVTGIGGSGKSVFTGIAAMLAGEHNHTSSIMDELDTPRERASLVGKSLITLPDQAKYTGGGAGIKAITGGDLIKVDPKHLKPFDTLIRAVIIATNNEPMRLTERQGGIARRRVIFPFNRQVDEKQRDPHLLKKLKAEIPVIMRCLLVDFAEPDTAKALLEAQRDSPEALRVKNNSDPLYGFCEHLIALTEATGMYMGNNRISATPRRYLYHAYLAYLEAYGHQRPLTLTTFGTNLPVVLKEFRIKMMKRCTNKGTRFNLDLGYSATEWLEEFI